MAEPVLFFDLEDVPQRYRRRYPKDLGATVGLRFFVGQGNSPLLDELFDTLTEEDNPHADAVGELLDDIVEDHEVEMADRLFPPRQRAHGSLFLSVFVGDVAGASAWLQERRANLMRYVVTDCGYDEDETLSEMLDRLGRSKATAARVRKRNEALERSLARLGDVKPWFRKTFGLKLPRHLAVWHALTKSLTKREAEGLSEIGFWSYGITPLLDGGTAVSGGHDPRLVARYRRDPPELVTVATGDSDGEHFGLWYDDPKRLPRFVASNFARDSAETELDGTTVIAVLARRIVARVHATVEDDEDVAPAVLALATAVEWFLPHDENARKKDRLKEEAIEDRPRLVGCPAPALDAALGNPRTDQRDQRARTYAKAMRTKRKKSKAIDRWIDEARDELASGRPAWAWALGHELHWLDADSYREASRELLVGAYDALGAKPLSRITELHHRSRDLERVPSFHA